MPLKVEVKQEKTKTNTIEYGYCYDEKNPTDRRLVYRIDSNLRKIEYHVSHPEYFFCETIVLTGFRKLPRIFSAKGYLSNHLLSYLKKNFPSTVCSLTVSISGTTHCVRKGKLLKLYFRYSDLEELSHDLGSADYYHRRHKSLLANHFLNRLFPQIVVKKKDTSTSSEIKRWLTELSTVSHNRFDSSDIDTLINILSELLKTKYRSQIRKSKLFRSVKIKFDSITLGQIIDKFEKNLARKMSESEWGSFLEENLFIIDSKYIHSIPQLNIVLGGKRLVDFGLMDFQGFLDIYEIKKPGTKLLQNTIDAHGNYSWHREAQEAITQAEKYHFEVNNKKSVLEDDLEKQKNIVIKVVRPRAFVLMGHSFQLVDKKQKEDFRILRNSLKNIDIVLYDELLERIKNQKKALEE